MSKKQKKKSVEKESKETKIFYCKDCKNRLNGADARMKMIQGKCIKTNSFVKRKDKICDQFKQK